jgi:hypothetical protein
MLNWVFRLYKDSALTSFIGTAFQISSDKFLTCKHVSDQAFDGKIFTSTDKSVSLGTEREMRLICEDARLDLSVYSFGDNECLSLPYPKLVEGIPDGTFCTLLRNNMICHGGASLSSEKLSGEIIREGLETIQILGSPKDGFSGSPLLLDAFQNAGVFGMMQRGGVDATHSIAIPSDKIISWLRENRCNDFETISLDSALESIVFGELDFREQVKSHWLSQWDYARNSEGVYVDKNGLELKDSTGSKLTESDQSYDLLREQGVNTGSQSYVEKLDRTLDDQ